MNSRPNSRTNLERSIQRFAVDNAKVAPLRLALANAIVAQMIGEGVVKGGSGLKFRFGEQATRVTEDLDTAYRTGLDEFLKDIKSKLADGWNGFTGDVIVERQSTPRSVPFEYVMQPCAVKLSYLQTPWFTVELEVGHNEIGDADEYDEIPVPKEVAELVAFLSFPPLKPIHVMKLEYQIAQKLHGASGRNSSRAHDLIDLQLIMANHSPDMLLTSTICRRLFAYRRQQTWPPVVVKNEGWKTVYDEQKGSLNILQTVDEAIGWANDLVARIDAAV